jgi:hypothetical protein
MSILLKDAGELRPQRRLAPLVMRSRRADGNAHHFGRLRKGKILVENQVQGFALPRGKLLKRTHQRFDSVVAEAGAPWVCGSLEWRGELEEPQPSKPVPAGIVTRSHSDNAVEPGLERPFPAVPRFALQNFQVNLLQHLFGPRPDSPAAAERPTKALSVKLFQLRSKLIHSHILPILACRGVSYDSCDKIDVRCKHTITYELISIPFPNGLLQGPNFDIVQINRQNVKMGYLCIFEAAYKCSPAAKQSRFIHKYDSIVAILLNWIDFSC